MKTRKLRHLRCIHIRNVDSTKYVADQGSGNDDESSCILATIVDSTNNEIVWKSTAEYDYDQAINASFSFMPSGQLDKILSDNFTIQIHKNSSCLLAEFSVDFSHVLYAGENVRFPIDTFECISHLYSLLFSIRFCVCVFVCLCR